MSTGSGAHHFAGEKRDTSRPRLERWRLPAVISSCSGLETLEAPRAVREWSAGKEGAIELPTINADYLCRPSRYIDGFTDYTLSTLSDGIAKCDTLTQSTIRWSEFGHTPGEPIFVEDPNGLQEDGGVLLSVVLDGNSEKSYLLVLDARTLDVVGKAFCEWPIGIGFHGLHVGHDCGQRPVDT